MKFITRVDDYSIFETIYPLYLKANIGRDAPDIILSTKPSCKVKRKSESIEYEQLESELLPKDAKKAAKVPGIENFNLQDEDKNICSFLFRADKTNSIRFINQTRNYEENQKYNRRGSASSPCVTYRIPKFYIIRHVICDEFICKSVFKKD